MPSSLPEWGAIAAIVAAVSGMLKDWVPRMLSTTKPISPRTTIGNIFAAFPMLLMLFAIGFLFYYNSESELQNTISSLSSEKFDLEINISSLQDTIKTKEVQADELLKSYEDISQTLKEVRDSLAIRVSHVDTLEKKLEKQESVHWKQHKKDSLKIQELTKKIIHLEDSGYSILLVASDAKAPCFVELKKKLIAWGFKVECVERTSDDDEDSVTFYVQSDRDKAQDLAQRINRHTAACEYSFKTYAGRNPDQEKQLQVHLALK